MENLRSIIFVTAYDPWKRIDVLLETLRGYSEIPGLLDVVVHIDWDSRESQALLEQLLKEEFSFNDLSVVVAGEEYEGFTLTWAHKEALKDLIKLKAYDIYIYTENDILFKREHFIYWYSWKDRLKRLNLEPGFCRFEKFEDKSVPFDNHRVWNLRGKTKAVWGERPYTCDLLLTPNDESLGFVSLGNPYSGMMILDQEMADVYVNSLSSNPVKSMERVSFRCWPIADRSSLGTAFENLLPNQEHRRVVPLILNEGKVTIAPYGLLEHMDTKYSSELSQKLNSVLDITEMFEL